MSGMELSIHETGCFWGDTQVLKFSSKFRNQIKTLREKGYFPVKAIIRHVVFWQDKDREKEVKIILPDAEFLKK
jgi:ATP-dependent DNA helicase RecQ